MREFRWIAQYANGRIVKELDYHSGRWRENNFFSLDLAQVISFGLEGAGLRVGFLTGDGIIGINGRALELALEDRCGNIFPLTGRHDTFYKVVHYKEAHFDLSVHKGRASTGNAIDAYCVGWETSGTDANLGDWYARLIAQVPAQEGVSLNLILSFQCARGFVGMLRVALNGKQYPRVDTLLRPGAVNQIAMHIQP